MNNNGQMITLYDGSVVLENGVPKPLTPAAAGLSAERAGAQAAPAGSGTIAYKILNNHDSSAESGKLKLKFDSLISHDITYVGIIQTARASGMTRFPIPYALTNCHNSLCAVGGTINEDDHIFGLSAAKKYGGVYVPANLAVIHQYARETLCEAGGMILGSDSHTRYGALGVMGIGEGGPELVKQLLNNTYDIGEPEVVLVWLENSPQRGVGPHDIAIALCGAVYESGFVRNKVLEFAGPGLAAMPIDFRFGIDVMTTETACLSSIWRTDDNAVSNYYAAHSRAEAYKPLAPDDGAVYGAMIRVDLSKAEPMAAMPFHPSKAFTIRELNLNASDILRETEREAAGQFGGKVNLKLTDKVKNGRVLTDQGIIAGCAGGMYDNIREAAAILCGGAYGGESTGGGSFPLSIYPSSMPVNLRLIEDGIMSELIRAGAVFKPCFCGPCFGAGDVPANNGLSIRHTTRNFINREGSRPGDGQLAAVMLMDARSIAATAKNGGLLTSAAEIEYGMPESIDGACGEIGGEIGGGIDSAAYARAGAQESDSARDSGIMSGNERGAVSYGVGAKSPLFNKDIYKTRVYNGFGKPAPDADLVFGPNIADWPKIEPLGENLLLRLASVIHDPVTTTDELIPSGEASSYRSNPNKLAEFTLSRRDPQYVSRSKAIRALEEARKRGETPDEAQEALSAAVGYMRIHGGAADRNAGDSGGNSGGGALDAPDTPDTPDTSDMSDMSDTPDKPNTSDTPDVLDIQALSATVQIASAIFARKPGDGSAREQAASCQRVLGGGANICYEYATKRYRSNLINWGILPFTIDTGEEFTAAPGDWIYIPGIRECVASEKYDPAGYMEIDALLIKSGNAEVLKLRLGELTDEERDIILQGCLMNYYAVKN